MTNAAFGRENAAFGPRRHGGLGLPPPPLAGDGWGGGWHARMSLAAYPHPRPPAEVGCFRLRPIHTWPNSGKPEFGCTRGRERTEPAGTAITPRRRDRSWRPRWDAVRGGWRR